MIDREKDTRHHRDGGKEIEAGGQLVAKQETSSQSRNNWLNVENHIDHRGVAVFQSESEENRADGGTGEPGEDHVTPGARANFRKLIQPTDEQREEHEEDENVLPENDYLRLEEVVQRNPPGAFCSPKGRAESDQPWSVGRAFSHRLKHAGTVYLER